MNRRRFLALAAAAGASAALTACGDGEVSGVKNVGGGAGGGAVPVSSTITVKVGDYPALATPDVLVQITGKLVAVKRTGSTTFDALSMVCTHAGCETAIVSNSFVCGCHGSRFDSSGNVTRAPANTPLQEFPTSYDAATDILTIN